MKDHIYPNSKNLDIARFSLFFSCQLELAQPHSLCERFLDAVPYGIHAVSQSNPNISKVSHDTDGRETLTWDASNRFFSAL